MHIHALRQHLGWKSPLLVATNLQWLEPIPFVTLLADIPVISMATSEESRVYIMKWGQQRYKCKQCKKTGCLHVRRYIDRDTNDEDVKEVQLSTTSKTESSDVRARVPN